MSQKVTYFFGYYNGLVYPFAPFDANGKIVPVINKNRSSASSLFYKFGEMKQEEMSEQMEALVPKYATAYWEYYDNISEVEVKDYMIKGYFLIDEVERYEKDGCVFPDEYFTTKLSPMAYAARLANESVVPRILKEDEPAISDYMFYSYVDENSEAYETRTLNKVGDYLYDWGNIPEDAKLVVICICG